MFKTTKAKVIFVAIFSVTCLIVTAILIVYQSIEIEESIGKISGETEEKDVPGIDLNGTYNQNNLEIEEKSLSLEQIEIRYFQISGLKNKEIENKINKEIEQKALNCYKEKVKDLNEVINVQVIMKNTANFANTVSFELSYYAKIDDDDDGFYQGTQGLNYDLNTGEKITIDKFFTSDAPIENVLRKSTYYSLVENCSEENLAGDFIVLDYGNIEDDVAEFIYLYKKGRITDFYYTPRYIYVCYDEDKIISIDMNEYAEYIAIYSRYLSEESLYENDNIGTKNVYTLAERLNNMYYYQNYQNENNYFIDIAVDSQNADSDEFAKKLINDKIVEIENEIETLKQKAAQHPNEFYILNYYIMVYTGDDWTSGQTYTTYYELGNTYEMTVHDFEENIEPIIMAHNKETVTGDWLGYYVYDFSEMLKIEPQSTTEYYNPEKKKKIVI